MRAFFDPRQDHHDPKSYLSRGQMRAPQEVPARTGRIVAGLRSLGVEIEPATDHGPRPIAAVHDAGYLRFLESAHRRWMAVRDDWGDEVRSSVYVRSPNPLKGILAESAYYQADGSCPIGAGTWEAAYWSAQSALSAAEAIRAGERVAYAVSRPPGHHARGDAAGGFCYLNNAAIAAQALLADFPRIAILDPDMHHGQGVQEIFYRRNDVFYASIHGDPTNFYPVCSGHEEERGKGPGRGYNLNLPMPHGSPESVFLDRLDEALAAIRLYAPDLLVVCLGFDIYREDPQARVSVGHEGFRQMGSRLAATGLPVLVVQEGGYHLDSLEENTRRFFTGLGA